MNSFPALVGAAVAGTAAAALSAPAAPQALVVGASGPAAARFPIGARIVPGQRLGLAAGDSLLILELGHSRRLTGPLGSYNVMSANRTTTLGLLAQVAQSSSLKVREQEARRGGEARRSRARGGEGRFFDVAAMTAKPFDRVSSPSIADPRQDTLPLARIVPGEVRHVCLMQSEPLFVARDPRDDARAPVRLTVTDAADASRTETVELAAGETWRAMRAVWRAVPRVKVTTEGTGAVGEAQVSAFELTEDRPDRLLSLYAGEECAQQAQQLYRTLKEAAAATP